MRNLTDEEKDNFLKWSEGNKYLYDLLCACLEHEIRTFASCGGHEENDSNPYLGIIIDDNSLPFIERMLGELQDMENIDMWTSARHSGDEQLYNDDVLRSITFTAKKHNCCEMFYKMRKAIEGKEKAKPLKEKTKEFFDRVKRLKETSKEELQEDVKNNVVVGSSFSTKTQEYIEYENSKKLANNSKLIRFFRKLLLFRKTDLERFEELQKKYNFLQKEYKPEREEHQWRAQLVVESQEERGAEESSKGAPRENKGQDDIENEAE